jgi:hypothetical protein
VDLPGGHPWRKSCESVQFRRGRVPGRVEVVMWQSWLWSRAWQWSRASNEAALGNARTAAVELSRHRVERLEVEIFLGEHRRGGRATGARVASRRR